VLPMTIRNTSDLRNIALKIAFRYYDDDASCNFFVLGSREAHRQTKRWPPNALRALAIGFFVRASASPYMASKRAGRSISGRNRRNTDLRFSMLTGFRSNGTS
jgi:hypothetical protein